MSTAVSGPRRTVLRQGLTALAKSVLLVVAVPIAIARLWVQRPLPADLFALASLSRPALWLHVVLVLLGLLWVLAAGRLSRELATSLRHRGRTLSGGWSSRWAGAIVALLLASSASAVALSSLPRPSPSAVVAIGTLRDAAPQGAIDPFVVAPGDCLANVAARALGDPARWPDIARANLDRRQVDGGYFIDANLLRPGWCLSAPPGTVKNAERATSTARGASSVLAELALVGLGALTCAALARRLILLRRVGASLRRPGEQLAAPQEETGALESMLLPFAEGSLLDWIDTANRMLGSIVSKADPGDVLLVRAGPSGVEFLFDEEVAAPPAPFCDVAGGRFWRLPLDSELASLRARADGAPRHARVLLPVGEDSDTVYLLNLTAGRRLVLEGAEDEVNAVLEGIVDALRVLPWANEIDVELLGIDAPPTDEQSYQLFSSTPATLRELGEGARGLGRRPTLVIANGDAGSCDGELLDGVAAVAGIVSCSGKGSATLRIDGGHGELAPFGLDLALSAPGPEQQRRIELLLAAASRSPALVDPSLLEGEITAGLSGSAAPAAGALEVRLLGGVPEVIGGDVSPAPRDAARVTELVAYLALHPRGASRAEISRALFGRATLQGAPVRLEVLLGAARRALGTDTDGRGQLLISEERIALGRAVTSDWMRFRATVAQARTVDAEGAISLLGQAFALLDAPTFTSWPPYDWLVADGLLEELRSCVVDGAHHLASLALAGGDHALAHQALATGRTIEPAAEILARDLMALAAEAGDLLGARQAFTDLEAALGELGGNEPSPETRALYRRLEGRRDPR